MCLEVECPYSLKLHIHLVLLLSLSKLSDCSNDWSQPEILDFPGSTTDPTFFFIISNDIKEILFSSHKCLPEVHLSCGELPFLRVFVSEDHISPILRCIVQGPPVLYSRVHINEVLRGCAIFGALISRLGPRKSMCWIVVQIHLTGVGVISENVFIQFGDLFKFIGKLTLIAVVFIHHLIFKFEIFEISISHCQKDWRSLNQKANIYSHKVSAEDIKGTGI